MTNILTALSGRRPIIAGVSFDTDNAVQFAAQTFPDGSDQWVMTYADDGNVYGVWGDGIGWNGAIARQYLGITRILGTPPSLTGVDIVVQPESGGVNHKPQGIIADQSHVMKMFTSRESDSWDGTYTASSSDNGTNWTFHVGTVYTSASDGVMVVGIAQFGSGYTGLPASVDSAYYYFYLQQFTAPTTWGGNTYLGRALKADIFTRANHQWFAGFSGSDPTWTSTFASKVAVVSDSASEGHFQAWWNPGIGRMIAAKGFSTSSLGFYDAPAPWGPFTAVYHQQFKDAFLKFTYSTPQKWMSGKTLWMAWSGYPEYDNVNFVQATLSLG